VPHTRTGRSPARRSIAACRCARILCACPIAAASSAVRKSNRHRPILPDDAIRIVFGLRHLRLAILRAPDRSSTRAGPCGSSRCGRESIDRTPPTTRAGRVCCCM
jgi:hypothetical protein